MEGGKEATRQNTGLHIKYEVISLFPEQLLFFDSDSLDKILHIKALDKLQAAIQVLVI